MFGIDMIGVQEREHGAPVELLDGGDQLVSHGGLKRPGHLEHELAAVVGDQAW